MNNYSMNIIFSKSKPLIIITLKNGEKLKKNPKWKQKFKQIDDKTYHISTVIIKEVFEENKTILGEWRTAKFEPGGVDKYYGFTKIKGMQCHSLDLSKRFVGDWQNEYTPLIRYTVNRGDETKLPITEECLYDNSIYGDGEVGDITEEEVDQLRKVINPDGEIITKMRNKLKSKKESTI